MRVAPAACGAGIGSGDFAFAGEIALAMHTDIHEAIIESTCGQGQMVAHGLASNAQVSASHAPLGTVRSDAFASGSLVSNQMRQLMQQGALDLVRSNLTDYGVQFDAPLRPPSTSRGGSHTRIPTHCNALRQKWQVKRKRPLAASLCQHFIRISS